MVKRKLASKRYGHLVRRRCHLGWKEDECHHIGNLWLNAVGQPDDPTRRPRMEQIPKGLKETQERSQVLMVGENEDNEIAMRYLPVALHFINGQI